MVVGVDRIDDGIITVRIRTTNVLYEMKGLVPKQEFGPPEEMNIADIWNWTGKPWGGLADGTSLVGTHLMEDSADKRLQAPTSTYLHKLGCIILFIASVFLSFLCVWWLATKLGQFFA